MTGCFVNCGHLYDANGACVPPAAPTAAASVYDACFCSNALLKPFLTGTAGVCDGVCTDATGLATIQSWYTSFCGNIDAAAAPTGAATTTVGASGVSGVSGSSTPTLAPGSITGQNSTGGTWYVSLFPWL